MHKYEPFIEVVVMLIFFGIAIWIMVAQGGYPF